MKKNIKTSFIRLNKKVLMNTFFPIELEILKILTHKRS